MFVKEVRDLVEECYQKAEAFLGASIPRAKVTFDLKGTSAGTFKVDKKGKLFLRFNRRLMVENKNEFRSVVIPHEVAHAIQRWEDKVTGRGRSAPHGREWKRIMIQIFKLPPHVTHSMDTSSVRKNTKPYIYGCLTCGTCDSFGDKKHAAMKKAPLSYRCKCGGRIKYVRKKTKKDLKTTTKAKITEVELD